MFGFTRYNYERFSPELMRRDMMAGFPGPEPGDRAPDFESRTLEGDKVRLSGYQGRKNVVLTFGSVTCPATAASIGGMNEVYDQFRGDDVEFLFVYVREAHPGELIPAHESMEHKAASAEILREEEGMEMPIVVDDLRGTIHRRYSKLPNSCWSGSRSAAPITPLSPAARTPPCPSCVPCCTLTARWSAAATWRCAISATPSGCPGG
jgi:hypothetical protein